MAERAGKGSPVLRFAIAGLGAAGYMMIPALLRHPHVEIAAAADLDREALEKFQHAFQAETHLSVEELCKSPNIDAIYIATPTHLHTEHALMALERRKHVVLEKPM